jgi:hypothetical protein
MLASLSIDKTILVKVAKAEGGAGSKCELE